MINIPNNKFKFLTEDGSLFNFFFDVRIEFITFLSIYYNYIYKFKFNKHINRKENLPL
jgi:hypothetical protein